MLGTAGNSLSVSQFGARPKSQRKDSVKENATIATAFIRKIPCPNRSQIVDELRKVGFSEIEASQALGYLEDNEEIFIVEDSSFLKVIVHRDISQYEREQSRFQEAWIKAKQQEDCFF